MLSNIARIRPLMNVWTVIGALLVVFNAAVLVTGNGRYDGLWQVGLILFSMAFIMDWRLAPVKVKAVDNGS